MQLEEMSTLLEHVNQLAALLENPNVLRYMELAVKMGKTPNVVPEAVDRLIFMGEAASILKVSNASICKWERQGLLTAYYTPGSKLKRYWLSDVMALPTRAERSEKDATGN